MDKTVTLHGKVYSVHPGMLRSCAGCCFDNVGSGCTQSDYTAKAFKEQGVHCIRDEVIFKTTEEVAMHKNRDLIIAWANGAEIEKTEVYRFVVTGSPETYRLTNSWYRDTAECIAASGYCADEIIGADPRTRKFI